MNAAASIAIGLVAALATPALAQDYPNRPIRIIVPFAPGGATDIPARLIAPKLAEALGQPVVIENRPGAGGIIGIEAAAKSAPDGYTLLAATNGELVMNPSIYPKLPYSPTRDFAPISIMVENPMLVVVANGVPYMSVRELVAAAKAKPGTIAYSTAGTGSTAHVVTELLAAETGMTLIHVPYKGGAPAAAALASGEVSLGVHSMGSVVQQVRGGKMRALAITRAIRHPSFPDLPTVVEAGVPGFVETIWVALAAPIGTPRDIVAKLGLAAANAVRTPDLRERLAAMGSEAVGSTPDEMATRINRETARYAPIIKQANIRAD